MFNVPRTFHSTFNIQHLTFLAMIRRFTASLLLLVGAPLLAADAAQIQLELKKLTVLGSAMYVAAHPDDDNAGLIGYLADERGLRTAYLSMTRGDGGQNL